MNDILLLINFTQEQNQYGVWEKTPISREVYCDVRSITRAEFYEAGRNGLNPSFEFIVFQGDYSGETICEYKGKQYAIYRTYIVPGTDYIELYAERQGGTNGEKL